MAVRHVCDVCGCDVDRDDGIVGEKEIVIEDLSGGKTSLLVSIHRWTQAKREEENPAMCAKCLEQALQGWFSEVLRQKQGEGRQ